jgi:phosphoribosylformylglycinamidine synthase
MDLRLSSKSRANHPSFIEPHHGAATGVGDIDRFASWARPIASQIHCGSARSTIRASLPHQGVVAGIGGYGNCVGCPPSM